MKSLFKLAHRIFFKRVILMKNENSKKTRLQNGEKSRKEKIILQMESNLSKKEGFC